MSLKIAIPKFKIDDIVSYDDDFSYNPAYKALSIGKVIGIHIMRGAGLYVGRKAKGKIKYTISGSSLIRKEEELQLIEKSNEFSFINRTSSSGIYLTKRRKSFLKILTNQMEYVMLGHKN